jgi:hypothetical protein
MKTQKFYLFMVTAIALAISGVGYASSAQAHDNYRRGNDAGISTHRYSGHHDGKHLGKRHAYHWNKARKWHHRKHPHHGHSDWHSHYRPHRGDTAYWRDGSNHSLSGIFFLSDW